MEKMDIKITNKIMYSEGFYEADVILNGLTQRKTFFPAEWSREKVTQTIVDFYEMHKHNAVMSHGVWIIEEKLLSGISLRVIISQTMEFITAYAILKDI